MLRWDNWLLVVASYLDHQTEWSIFLHSTEQNVNLFILNGSIRHSWEDTFLSTWQATLNLFSSSSPPCLYIVPPGRKVFPLSAHPFTALTLLPQSPRTQRQPSPVILPLLQQQQGSQVEPCVLLSASFPSPHVLYPCSSAALLFSVPLGTEHPLHRMKPDITWKQRALGCSDRWADIISQLTD